MGRLRVLGALLVASMLGSVALGAGPATAADDEVRLRMPRGFVAGGPPGPITIEVRRREDGCVSASVLLGIELPGAAEGQVRAAVRQDGRWRRLRLSHVGGGRFLTEPVTPDHPRVCADEDAETGVRLQVGFAAGAPAGAAEFVAEAYTEFGDLLDRTDESRDVRGGRGASPSATPGRAGSPTASPRGPVPAGPSRAAAPAETPSASPDSAGPARSPAPDAAPPGVRPTPGGDRPTVPAAASGDGDGPAVLTAGSIAMGLGLLLVAAGATLLVLLVRQNRGEPGDDTDPTAIVPR